MGLCKVKKFHKSELTMEVGGWVKASLVKKCIWGELYPVLFWICWIFFNFAKPLWAIPQKRLPQGEKIKVTYKVCFPLNINEEGLHFDDEVKKVRNYMTSISFSAIKTDNILQEL